MSYISTSISTQIGTAYLTDFGAKGDGVTNDAAAISAALVAGLNTIDGKGRTYKVNSALTHAVSNIVIQNATFDFSSYAASNGKFISATGTLATGISLTADTAAGSAIVIVGSTATLSVDDIVFLSSAKVWDSVTSVTYGQLGRIKSIDSATQVTLYEKVVVSFNTADSATIAKISPLRNITYRRVNLIGGGANTQTGFDFRYCENVNIIGCETYNIDYLHIGFRQCYAPLVDNCHMRKATATGLAYGVGIIDACYAPRVISSWGYDLKHTVTIGGTVGLNLHSMVESCHAMASKDAGFDSHPSSMFTTFSNNEVQMSAAQFGSTNHDGLISQGAHTTFIGNTISGAMNNSIVYAPSFQDGSVASAVIAGNTIVLDDVGISGDTSIAILAQSLASTGAPFTGVNISDNNIRGGANNVTGSHGIWIQNAHASNTLKRTTIKGNIIDGVSQDAIRLVAQGAAAVIDGFVVQGNIIEGQSAQALYCLVTGANGVVKNGVIAGNVLKSATRAIRLNAGTGTIDNVKVDRQTYDGISAANTILKAGAVTNCLIIDAEDAAPVDLSDASVAIVEYTNWYTFSRGTAQVVTLPDPTSCVGRLLHLRNTAAQTVDSASSNVVPITGGAAGTAINAANDGEWADLRSDGTNWLKERS